jgi:hypothetical protein
MKIKVNLQPIVSNLNLPTVLKTAILPGDSLETLFIATQVGEIFYIRNGSIGTLLDIHQRIIQLGTKSGGYDERGLLGLAFHPNFDHNGLFYLHYSVAETQGPGTIPLPFEPDPCDPETLNLQWLDRENHYDHIDTVEEWVIQANGQPKMSRTLLNIRRPFANHNGVNSLNFSPESGRLVLTTGDGGAGYDPFNLSQNDLEIAGKIIEIDVDMDLFYSDPPVVTRFDELPPPIAQTLTVIAKGVRNITGISFQWYYNQYIKYIGNVGQDLVESVFAFTDYKPLPVEQLVQAAAMNSSPDLGGFINFGWRGWEGAFPTTIIRDCSDDQTLSEQTIAYYDEAVEMSILRIPPLTCYFHHDPRPDKFGGTALTGVHPYMGRDIPELTGCVLFTDFVRDEGSRPGRGVLACTMVGSDCKLSDYTIIETDYDFGDESSYYVSLGANLDQTRIYLGIYGSMNVTEYNLGTVFEIIP